jgi:tRNA modification GTPase
VKTKTSDDTIAAIATPPGEGGIGIVRISGSEAVPIAGRLFFSRTGRQPGDGARRVYYGEIRDAGAVIDEVLVHVMHAPHSYTREDVVEINCHGGAVPLHAVLDLALRSGARLASPGEFTRRAFLNGRIDLVQAEAVIDRIRAQGRAALLAASAASRGVLSKELHAIREVLTLAKSHVEAAIDFPDQDVPDTITPELRRAIVGACARMETLLATADAGRLLREGAAVAIAGRPNVGKSSLFNALLRESRAIVTARPGTTRDLIQETILVQGIAVRLTDMAGLRDTEDDVERIGVERAREALSDAALILLVVDAESGLVPDDEALARELAELETPMLLAVNKVDAATRRVDPPAGISFAGSVRVSALTGQGLPELEAALGKLLTGGAAIAPDQALITRTHQKESLRRALEATRRVESGFTQSPEFLALELDEALRALGEITGETTPDDILEHIFGAFCIGK